ncbi:MAG: flagellar positioning protein PflI [Phenylobacterium sp.]|nr:MAG: flagellar positioning protein PflI [Phenylobacterium sp.]
MSLIAIAMNLLLAGLLAAALVLGLRLNRRLKALRDSHDNFAVAVRELNAAAERAEQGLADLRAATDEATDTLADRIDKGRALAVKLERLIVEAPRAAREAPAAERRDEAREQRLGALLSAAREARGNPDRALAIEPPAPPATPPRPRVRASVEDDLFDEPPLRLHQGGRP